jgi:WD40 repeat protein
MLWFSPDGSRMVTISHDEYYQSTTTLWATDEGQVLARIVYPGEATAAAFSTDGELLAVSIGYYVVAVYNVDKLIETRNVTLDNLLAVTADNELIRNVIQGESLGRVSWIGFDSDNSTLVTLDPEKVLFWDITEPQNVGTALANGETLVSTELLQDQELAVDTRYPITIGGDDVHFFSRIDRRTAALNTINTASETMSASLTAELPDANYVRMTADASGLLVSDDAGVQLIDPVTSTPTGGVPFETVEPPVYTSFIDMSQDGTLLVTADYGLLRVWDLPTGEHLAGALMADDSPRAAILSPDKSRLAVVFRTVIVIWELNLTT